MTRKRHWRFTSYLFGFPTAAPFTWWAWYPVKTQSGQWKWFTHVGCVQIQKHHYLQGPEWTFYAYSGHEIHPEKEGENK